jgi:hypothetical protein
MNLNKKYKSGGSMLKYQNSGRVMNRETIEAVNDFLDKEQASQSTNYQEGGEVNTKERGTDNLDFGDAFNFYRDKLGPGQRFMWKGKPYTTDTEEEMLSKLIEEDNSQMQVRYRNREMPEPKNTEITRSQAAVMNLRNKGYTDNEILKNFPELDDALMKLRKE